MKMNWPRIIESKPEGLRSKGRPCLRLMNGVDEDLSKLGIKGRWMVARGRESWKKILRQAEAGTGL